MSLLDLLESMGTLKRPNIERDLNNGTTQETYTTLVENFPCSVQPASSSARMLYMQRNTAISAQIYVESYLGAQINDIIEVTDIDGNLHKFQVIGESPRLFQRIESPFVIDVEEVV
jgi:hypothetical protein